jgi:hypothetical protein
MELRDSHRNSVLLISSGEQFCLQSRVSDMDSVS